MIRFIIRTIIILVILILLAPIVFAVDIPTRDKVFNEVKSLCSIYSKMCTVEENIDKEYMWAHTGSTDNIKISSSLRSTLNEAQLRGVLFHEAGHVILNHVGRTIDYLSMCGNHCDPQAISSMRRRYEKEADRFAAYVGVYTNKDVDLIGALLILTDKEDIYKTQPTHPSTADRIREIWSIQNAK